MLLVFDTETTGADFKYGCKPFYLSIALDTGLLYSYYWDVDPKTRVPKPPTASEKKQIRELFGDADLHVGHNIKFDYRALKVIGLDVIDWSKAHDTQLQSHTHNSEESHKLKDLGIKYLDQGDGDEYELKEAVNQARTIGNRLGFDIARAYHPHFPALKRAPNDGWGVLDYWLPRAVALHEKYPANHSWYNVCSKYGDLDVWRTMGLYWVFEEALQDQDLTEVYEERRGLLEATYAMETRGLHYSPEKLHEGIDHYRNEARRYHSIGVNLSGGVIDNLDSPQQVSSVLYGADNLAIVPPQEAKTKTGWSTKAEILEELLLDLPERQIQARFIQTLLKYRRFNKAVEYLESYDKFGLDEYLYSSINIAGTNTTRSSSSFPNTQNISKREDINLRAIFCPDILREWYAIDYDNIELRIFAYESGDQNLIDAFEQGLSVHIVIAEKLWPKELARMGVEKFKETDKYRWVKNGNFSLIYGASEKKADRTYKQRGAYRKIRKEFPLIDAFIESKVAEARATGYVRTLGGYPLKVPLSKPHAVVNYFVQGTAGWIITKAINKVYRYLSRIPDHYLTMLIHDELLFDFPTGAGTRPRPKLRTIKHLMELSGDELGIPTPASIKRITLDWSEGEEVRLAA